VRRDERRGGRELVLELVFRPLASLLARLLLRTRVSPLAVVLANAVAGLLAAAVLARGELVTAALLLQLKTLLDNADGRLARMSGRVTLVGRYLDTEADLVVNAALFAALAHVTGQPWLALVAFLALTPFLRWTSMHRSSQRDPG
jgi:phosphatidylglycerophosphate synthase